MFSLSIFSKIFAKPKVAVTKNEEKPRHEIIIVNCSSESSLDILSSLKSSSALTPFSSLDEYPSIDEISKKEALRNLQDVLCTTFGRKTSDYDLHGVKNFTIEKNVLQLSDEEVIKFGKFSMFGKQLKGQANSFSLCYIEGIGTSIDAIRKGFEDKTEGRTWMRMFPKHFQVTTSEISICYAPTGESISNCDENGHIIQINNTSEKVYLATLVGFDVSAHRLTGVHFGDFLRCLKRLDGGNLVESSQESTVVTSGDANQKSTNEDIHVDKDTLKIPIESKQLILWIDAYNHWQRLGYNPQNKYCLNEDVIINDYRLMYSLLFHQLKKLHVEVPILSALGCGVFGRSFPEKYRCLVAHALADVIKSAGSSFKGIILCEILKPTAQIFIDEFKRTLYNCKMPVYVIVNVDMLELALQISKHHIGSTSILNAGDFWEFGQFFECGGSLEEYITRMTTAYISNHWLLNPLVLDSTRYEKVSMDDLGIKIYPEYIQSLKDFIKNILKNFV